MSTFVCYLGLGSNLDNPREQMVRALQNLAAHPAITLRKQSPWYVSKAIGLDKQQDHKQPDYINGVIEIETSLEPHVLLLALQKIEAAQGRTREVRWAARTLDIDILLYGDQQIHSADLDIPHPRIMERNFVLLPLIDINPALPLSLLDPGKPTTGKNETIASLSGSLTREGLRRVDE
jgi:2-amino-4-hydroxy-6-hydroxymethyldihydropteridine diphosphokinase